MLRPSQGRVRFTSREAGRCRPGARLRADRQEDGAQQAFRGSGDIMGGTGMGAAASKSGIGPDRAPAGGRHRVVGGVRPRITRFGPVQLTTGVTAYDRSSSGTLPPFSASFRMTCLWSHTFIAAGSAVSPV
jgi:hypothetical protein